MNSNLAANSYRYLFDEISAIFTERVKNAREEMARAYWETGKVLREFSKKNDVEITALLKRVAGDNVSERTL